MHTSLKLFKEQLPYCKTGILKLAEPNDECLDHCIVEFRSWKNFDTITCTTNLKEGEAEMDILTSGEVPVTIKFINRKKNLYVVITGSLIFYRKNFLLWSTKIMAEIRVESAEFFKMKHYGKSIRLLEPFIV